MRLIVRCGAFLSVGFVVVAVVVGCGSSASIDFIAPNASSLLYGRRLAVGIATGTDNTDIFMLQHRHLVNVTKSVREAAGADQTRPADQARPFSLSPNGRYIAFFLQAFGVACTTCQPILYVMRSDGSEARSLGANLAFAGFSSVWTPSWDRNGRSFVIAAPKTGLDPNTATELGESGDDDTGLFRFDVPSGKETELTVPGVDAYDYAQPAVSPDGRKIAFLRSVAAEPTEFWNLSTKGIAAFVYVMRANGKGTKRLPLPARPYSSLWWCGNTTVCVDSPTKNLPAPQNTYRIELRTGKIAHLRHWAEATYLVSGSLSPAATFAINERKTSGRAEVFASPLTAGGVARFGPVLAASHAKNDPFWGFSVSGR